MGHINRARLIRLAAIATIALFGVAADAASRITIAVNQSMRVGVNGAVANILVSDSSIADVTVVDTHSVIVMGKGFGTAHVLALDSAGHSLLDTAVSVVAPEGSLTLYRGPTPLQFSCSPRCEMDSNNRQSGSSSAASGAPPAP